MTNYIFSPWKMKKKKAVFHNLFWYKVFVQWKLKLRNFLMDSVLNWWNPSVPKVLPMTVSFNSPSTHTSQTSHRSCIPCCSWYLASLSLWEWDKPSSERTWLKKPTTRNARIAIQCLKKKCLKETLYKRGPVSGVLKPWLTLYLLVFNFSRQKYFWSEFLIVFVREIKSCAPSM